MFVPNFKFLGAVVPEKSDTYFPMHYIGEERWKKGKMEKKEGKINSNIMVFLYTINFNLYRCIQSLKTLALISFCVLRFYCPVNPMGSC